MMYSYVTATDIVKIDLDDQFCKLLFAMDQEEYNSNRKHSRRHPIPLDHCEYQGEWFEDTCDIVGETEFEIDLERAL